MTKPQKAKKLGSVLLIKHIYIWKLKCTKLFQKSPIYYSTNVINLTSWEPELDWADSDLCNNRRIEKADSVAM